MKRGVELDHFYQLGWQLDPLGGSSGEAYKAEQDGRKLFIKKCQPFPCGVIR